MTLPGAPLPDVAPATEPVPTGIRVASTLCWLVGILTILVVAAVAIPPVARSPQATGFFAVDIAAGVMVCVAGYLVRQRRKVGALLVVLAWALPTVLGFALGGGPRSGNFLLFVAMIVLLLNWKHLR